MYEALGALGGYGAGGLLGQLGDVMSAPRRAVWRTLGAPEEGNQLIAQLLGLDSDSGLARGLGLGAEMLLDPLNIVGAGLGALGGGGVRALGRMNKMDDLMDSAEAAKAAASGFDKAADAQRVADYAAESRRLKSVDPHFGTPTTYPPEIISQVPDLGEIARIAARKDMAGSTLTPTGMKSYPNFSDDAARLMNQDYLGGVNPRTGSLEVLPNVRRDPKADKFVAPPSLAVKGNKAVLDPMARSPIPEAFLPDMPPSLRPVEGGFPRVTGGMARMPESATEARLRLQSTDAMSDRDRLLKLLADENNPENFGLIEDMYFRGMESPLAQALMMGGAAGGSMYAGSQFMGG